MRSLALVTLTLLSWIYGCCSQEFHESLSLQSLGQGFLISDFKFEQSIKFPPEDSIRHIETFSNTIHEIFDLFQILYFRLAMSRKRWQYEKWGNPPWNAAPVGVKLESLVPKSHPTEGTIGINSI